MGWVHYPESQIAGSSGGQHSAVGQGFASQHSAAPFPGYRGGKGGQLRIQDTWHHLVMRQVQECKSSLVIAARVLTQPADSQPGPGARWQV